MEDGVEGGEKTEEQLKAAEGVKRIHLPPQPPQQAEIHQPMYQTPASPSHANV
jgi:hypothetical protein